MRLTIPSQWRRSSSPSLPVSWPSRPAWRRSASRLPRGNFSLPGSQNLNLGHICSSGMQGVA